MDSECIVNECGRRAVKMDICAGTGKHLARWKVAVEWR